MAVGGVSNTTNTSQMASSRSTIADNFDTFLSILTTQLKNQNPLDPMDTNQFTQQLVQFTGVEQQLKTNDFLEALMLSGQNTAKSDAVSYIGKEVTSSGRTGELTDNNAVFWAYSAEANAANATITIKDAKGQITTYRSQGRGMARDIPLVVLINPGSASAAEILAGALQENERAKLIGEATTGTGTVLRPFSLSDGSLLRLGVTNWLTPGYNLIKGHGIQPDVKIAQEATVEMISSVLLEEIDEGEMRTHEDRQFLAALRMLNLLVQPRNQAQTTPSGMP